MRTLLTHSAVVLTLSWIALRLFLPVGMYAGVQVQAPSILDLEFCPSSLLVEVHCLRTKS